MANDNDRQTEDIDACGNKLTFFDLFFLLPRQVPPPFPAGVFFIFFDLIGTRRLHAIREFTLAC